MVAFPNTRDATPSRVERGARACSRQEWIMTSPVLERFLRYVAYDTQSCENADTYPSTPGPLVLLRDLVTELRALGLTDAAIDEHGYVTATIPANMREVLDHHPVVVERAREAITRAGLEVRERAIRGGTDGSRLSFMGLPTPNLFAGEQNFHSRLEWVSVQDMEKAVDAIVQLAMVWEERG